MPDNSTVREAYRKGYQDGLAESEKLLRCACITNNQLWNEVFRLDFEHPVGNTGVIISLDLAESLLKMLRHSRAQPVFLFRRRIQEARQQRAELVRKLEAVAGEKQPRRRHSRKT